MANFRGIAGVVRRAINNQTIAGEIIPYKVRELLPDHKKAAPDSVILNSLRHLADLKEIEEKNGAFFTKAPLIVQGPATLALSRRVMVIGTLVTFAVKDAQTTATVVVEELKDVPVDVPAKCFQVDKTKKS